MKMQLVRERAKQMAIATGSMDKKTLIRLIQEKEGNTPCFKTDPPACDQFDCCWREDCNPGERITMS